MKRTLHAGPGPEIPNPVQPEPEIPDTTPAKPEIPKPDQPVPEEPRPIPPKPEIPDPGPARPETEPDTPAPELPPLGEPPDIVGASCPPPVEAQPFPAQGGIGFARPGRLCVKAFRGR